MEDIPKPSRGVGGNLLSKSEFLGEMREQTETYILVVLEANKDNLESVTRKALECYGFDLKDLADGDPTCSSTGFELNSSFAFWLHLFTTVVPKSRL
ncbi:hypothetical protein LWI29_009486 [Acer saccharum]|uniref:Uncharacterized protein n=1 Tax=Acer saccharum TaxID=4024 RepID=A0AA39RQK2_ACESA|nr:hypothetical protein LWI29_009486 [Acer saccharum]